MPKGEQDPREAYRPQHRNRTQRQTPIINAIRTAYGNARAKKGNERFKDRYGDSFPKREDA